MSKTEQKDIKLTNDSFGNPTNDEAGYNLLKDMNQHHQTIASWGFSQFEIKADDICLDAGCGGGANIMYMAQRAAHVTGIDISAMSCKVSQEVNDLDIKNNRVNILQSSIEDFKGADESFSLVTAFCTIYFWNNRLGAFQNIYRMLKPNGRFCLIASGHQKQLEWRHVPDLKVVSEYVLMAEINQAGFSDITISFEPTNGYIVIQAIKK
ncbi:class I SAM-dependent methyltransferase [Ureaplasma miroungigenitalium]|uniref:Class I SAM-dependent methyltransferase n=1 Tax=Ureaplasma miroungigenitalium TaxID=1042321 RepID=A0ABT3BMZ0_9BACT|nr:class I SAM-dependent methyltransferase [Ureaplasma miroungigenitalium]MCV3728595.1 class I SAM-dependent methyltransferase [Ureaplasma miroungigenitalium]MCV3734398.1 class I SAM-dependent methyltransferase [Ureaplasma miroungigenitalium]